MAEPKTVRKIASPDTGSARSLLSRFVKEAVDPHAEEIAKIASRGGIAIVVLDPSDTWRAALGVHGWNQEQVSAMSERVERALRCADEVTENWIAKPRPHTTRIFAVIHDASLLVNGDARGFRIEPGSTDEGAAL